MSEKFYAWLLRLYPAQFRADYGHEALQLFRDRAREETDFFPRLRLWMDLLLDLVVSIPRAYGYAAPAPVTAAVPQHLYGVPAFCTLENPSLRPSALLFGCLLSSLALATFWIILSHPGNYSQLGNALTDQPHTNPGFLQSPAAPQGGARPMAHSQAFTLDAAERRRVVAAAASTIEKYYIDRGHAHSMADSLLAHLKRGDDDAVTDGDAFASLLTRQMRDVSPDRHLSLEFSQNPLPENLGEESPEALAQYRQTLKAQNCTIEKTAILPQNIGYLKLNSFPDVQACQPAVAAAMASLNQADAIILDLRDNRGGQPDMVMLLASYLFDHPEYMYNPRENTTERSWTHSPVPGNHLADKPAYILTSATTFSAAEHFSYDLQMLKRATIVGETTGGGAHSGVFHRLDDHFGMGIPETRSINPFAKNDWAEVGVEPDVKVKSADALIAAQKLAQSKLEKR